MKRILILFFTIFTITTFGLDFNTFPKDKIDLAAGVTLPVPMKFNDFSTTIPVSTKAHASVFGENIFDPDLADSWYHTDFASDPFDGVIEVLTVGQPSTSTTMTLIITCLFGLLLVRKKYIFQLDSHQH